MPNKKSARTNARPLLLLGVAMLTTVSGLTGAQGRHAHRRATSFNSAWPVSQDQETNAATTRGSLRRLPQRLKADDAKITQLDPRLRGSDGHLAEKVIDPRDSGRSTLPDIDDLIIFQGVAPAIYWRGVWRHHHFPHRRR